jgi:hypothetical protein
VTGEVPESEEQRRARAKFERRVSRTLHSMQESWPRKWFWFGLPLWVRLVLDVGRRIAVPILTGIGIATLIRLGYPPEF